MASKFSCLLDHLYSAERLADELGAVDLVLDLREAIEDVEAEMTHTRPAYDEGSRDA